MSISKVGMMIASMAGALGLPYINGLHRIPPIFDDPERIKPMDSGVKEDLLAKAEAKRLRKLDRNKRK
jgi:hypothetical protein